MRWIALVGVAAVVALLAGCGGDGSGEKTAAAPTDAAAVSEDEAMKKEEAAKEDEAAKDGDAMKDEDAGAGSAMKADGPATIEVIDSDFGRVIADADGEAYYLFDKEQSPESECFDECAEAWPPAVTQGEPKAGSGADQALIGTAERPNGEVQITYDGHPLYYYVDDSPGTILCHNVDEFGGLWLVVQPDGEPVA
ncbi:MAG: hypothetical protein R2725_09685 [Solirubrobacterales bacterium]